MNKHPETLKRILRLLVTALGAGLGAIIAATIVAIVGYAGNPMSKSGVLRCYLISVLVSGGILFMLSQSILTWIADVLSQAENIADKMTIFQLISSTAGLLVGLALAALLTTMFDLVETNVVTVCLSAIVYLLLGYAGMRIGRKRSGDLEKLWQKRFHIRTGVKKTFHRRKNGTDKLLDTSVLIDGRVLEVARTGFLESELLIPGFVAAELQHLADSADPLRRAKGKRGLELLEQLKKEIPHVSMVETDDTDPNGTDAKLLHIAQKKGCSILTNDTNLGKMAAASGVKVLNIHVLSCALQTSVRMGDEMTVQLNREGKEPGQAVAYMEDGTMVVVEGAAKEIGTVVNVVVTSVLKTAAGRMIFAKKADIE